MCVQCNGLHFINPIYEENILSESSMTETLNVQSLASLPWLVSS